MCGILGITGSREAAAQEALKTFQYRGPDATAVYADEQVTLGHNRLSIIDLDPRSTQPFFDTTETVGIVFNGEIYNYRELKEELIQLGIEFRTTSDTEVLVYAYKTWGADFVERLRGMYALAIYDRQQQMLYLYTDQVAMKPLFYRATKDSFMFASELKGVISLIRAGGESLTVDDDGLTLYYALGFVPAPRTLYAGIQRLPPRTRLAVHLADRTVSVTQYAMQTTDKHSVSDLQQLLEESVRAHLIADVPVGLFFSGGTDSSLIAASLKACGASLKAFSVSIVDRPEDSQYAPPIASALGFTPETYTFGVAEFDAVYPLVTKRIDEPIADSSLYPSYFIAEKAARQVKVVLSGEGGDEFFYGYPRSRALLELRDAPLDADMSTLDRVFFALPAFRGKNRLFEMLFTWFRRPISFYLLTMSPTKSLMSITAWKQAKRALAQSARTANLLDADIYLPNILMRKIDLATMYASLEGRMPLLDNRVIAFALANTRQSVGSAALKPLLKQVLATYLPASLVHRPKTGFGLRTHSFLTRSTYLQRDLEAAISYLSERKLLRIAVPSVETMIHRYPNSCWQIVALYHAVKNAGL